MARASQASPHTRHSTPRCAKQAALKRATQPSNTAGACKAPGSHARTQAPQASQPACAKCISGNPPSPRRITCGGQAFTQASQRVQRRSKAASAKAPGGRCTARCAAEGRNMKRRRGSMRAL